MSHQEQDLILRMHKLVGNRCNILTTHHPIYSLLNLLYSLLSSVCVGQVVAYCWPASRSH
ncbi:hypothetical protein LINPERPRIM_LOCUS855 [Linum perenne]